MAADDNQLRKINFPVGETIPKETPPAGSTI